MRYHPGQEARRRSTRSRAHLAELGIDIPVDDEVDPAGRAGRRRSRSRDGSGRDARPSPNRFAVLPMEGWDGTDRRPADRPRAAAVGAVRRRAAAGWCGARRPRCAPTAGPTRTSSCSTRRPSTTSPRCGRCSTPGQVAGLQLTHSGRWSRPDGAPAPRTAYAPPAARRARRRRRRRRVQRRRARRAGRAATSTPPCSPTRPASTSST